MALAALGDDAEAGEGAPLAGDVEGRVAAVVGQLRVGASLQEPLGQVRLLGDHCQVEGSLEGSASNISPSDSLWPRWDSGRLLMCKEGGGEVFNYLSLVVLDVEERVIAGQLDHVQRVFGGFVNDGQVEEPARWGGGRINIRNNA